MEYDPSLNWNCRNADPAPEEFKRKVPLRKKQLKTVVQSLSIDGGLNKKPQKFPQSTESKIGTTEEQRSKLDTENPRFIQ